MTLDEFLGRLDGVRTRGQGKWSALCPAHGDKSPSLSIREGERGILMKCFAGCTSAEIVATLGLRLADLFFDVEYDPQARHIAAIQRDHERRQREAAADKRGRFIDGCKHADQFIESRQGLDISNWSEDRLDRELNLLADAYTILEHDPYAGC